MKKLIARMAIGLALLLSLSQCSDYKDDYYAEPNLIVGKWLAEQTIQIDGIQQELIGGVEFFENGNVVFVDLDAIVGTTWRWVDLDNGTAVVGGESLLKIGNGTFKIIELSSDQMIWKSASKLYYFSRTK